LALLPSFLVQKSKKLGNCFLGFEVYRLQCDVFVDLKKYTKLLMRHQSASDIISNAKQSQKIVSTFENFPQIFGSLHILGLQKLILKSTKVHGKSLFIENNHINIYLM